MQEKDIILEARNIHKHFPGVNALQDINISVKRCHVHAILGENGAGKSTLVKILSGAYKQTSGEIIFNGETLYNLTPKTAGRYGIAIVHQELNLVREMTVAENIFLGREITNLFQIDSKKTCMEADKLLKNFNINFSSKTKISNLSIAEQQMVEIVKAISLKAKLIIMDEPTDVLTDKETEQLFALINRLKNEGKTIIYISHRLDELKIICDDFSVLRDGKHIVTDEIKSYTKDKIVEIMVNRKLDEQYPYIKIKKGHAILSLENITLEKNAENISFNVCQKEILGIYGLVGSGRTELLRAVIGADKMKNGSIYMNGNRIKITSPSGAIKNGIVYITESRKDFGIIPEMDIKFNATISILNGCINKIRKLNYKIINSLTNSMIEKFSIKCYSSSQEVKKLSGGNQQKVLLARYLLTNPKVLIIDEPTRGIDVGTKNNIYHILNTLKENGMAIIMISSELPEILGVSDRIIVMYKGKISKEFKRHEANEIDIGAAAFGQNID